MKFNEAEDKIEEIKPKKYSKSKGYNSEKYLRVIYRYDNLSICVMSPGTKGDFKYLSTLVSDGENQTSWCIRVYITNNKWTAQIAPNSLIENVDINMSEILDQFDSNINVSSTLHTGIISSINKENIESAINKLIEIFRNKKLNTDNFEINKKYILKNNSNKFKLEYNISEIKINDINMMKKYLKIYLILKEKKIDDISLNQINITKLDLKGKEVLFKLSKKYLTEHERINIAMKFMLKDK